MPNTNAANITGLELERTRVPDSALQNGDIRTILDTVETPTVLSIGDTVTLARLPAGARLISVKLATDDLGTAGDIDLGFSRTIKDGGAAIDADALAADLDVNTAAVAFTERRFTALDIDTVQQPIWQLAGLSAIPEFAEIDIVATATEATTAAGTISIQVQYSIAG